MTLRLLGDSVSGAQVLLDQSAHRFFERCAVGYDKLARLFRRLLGKLDDGLDHRLEVAVAEHHGAEHDLLGQLLRFRLDHQHRVLGAGDDEIELALQHLVELRIEHIFVVDEADAGGADRAHERRARERQCRRGGDHRQDVGVVLEIVREHMHDHLGVAAPPIREQRPDRAVDQSGDERLALGGPAFTLEITARDAAGRVELLEVVAGERQEVDAFLRLLGGDHGREQFAFAISGDDGAVGLASDLAGL